MSKNREGVKKVSEGIEILKVLGLPRSQQNERSALTFLAVLDIKAKDKWSDGKKRLIRIHDILLFIQKEFKRKYAENTRETIRRQTLHQFEQAGVVERNTDDPSRPTNSPNTVYCVSDEALTVVKAYKTRKWDTAVAVFAGSKGRLVDRYEKRRQKTELSLILGGGKCLKFSPGKHNELQIKIIKELKPRFCSGAVVIYMGDTANKSFEVDRKALEKLGILFSEHDKLPDVLLYDKAKNHLLLIEAVTSHGPISPKRQIEFQKALKGCKVVKIFISAFPDFKEFKRHIDNIAWETEVWIATNPDHMVHFNGPKFFTAY
ncbi:MAG: restriction endonuclease [Candidatus Omnitrophica bacterium CG_4_10_14_0_2_um_filter_44_9]|nr:MAG: restriction endonuclease [Candidatus Omnitrophica bacterium CG_4_10_14_0_8_um_filter_44_12]PIZ84994.1 MAG: restriction endonuclease [Candidatus Omnitrophica bacterium CG_4_10_14_0_2_um_filter_44_9]